MRAFAAMLSVSIQKSIPFFNYTQRVEMSKVALLIKMGLTSTDQIKIRGISLLLLKGKDDIVIVNYPTYSYFLLVLIASYTNDAFINLQLN